MQMIDIAEKEITQREAVVEATLLMKPEIIELIRKKKIPKGDVLEAAKIAGILAAKKTPDIIPLCHPIPIDFVQIDIGLKEREIKIIAKIKGKAKTGVEMEGFTAVSVAALTVYDMCKAMDREITISHIRLIKKTGGRSGMYVREKEVSR